MQLSVDNIIAYLSVLAKVLPLELFAFIGSFAEEVIGPIPSPLILMTIGSLASVRHYHWIYILFLTAVASAGKTLASYVFFIIADKAEDLVFGRFGRYLGVSHKQIEAIGAYFNGTSKDDIVIILSRAIPFFPTLTVSLAAGFFKINQINYLKDTFIGYFIRCLMFVYLGFTGLATYESFAQKSSGITAYLPLVITGLIVAFLVWLYFYGKHHSLKSWFQKFS